ncbi:MAG: indole-3-glycerol phosphate synthase TrpC [Actinobacteria bacterium]|uniref:indole-3-glycerol-phosphate synthase n=1 Tax=freshwater metagenome TaxID=449393 RepID=A0A6J6MYB4_9ZZZZ|nr:indole-3-glycerol phosphate synthase TrpC [Actinomycetota bacterium]
MTDKNVLDEIMQGVLLDLASRQVPINDLKQQIDLAPKLRGAKQSLSKAGTSLIAEIKRSSPSKGALSEITDPVALAKSYERGGADLISVLTEERRFNGKIADLIAVRDAIGLPVLRKDFILTEFQVYESRLLGADLILLIVAALSNAQLRDLYQLSTELGMDVLVEVHDEEEAQRAIDLKAEIIGVNSRNLKTLEVSDLNFERIFPHLPKNVIKVAESGIATRAQVEFVESLGADAILVGESLVKSGDPEQSIKELLNR